MYALNNSLDVSEQLFQILRTLVTFLFTALICGHLIANVMILPIVSLLLKSLSTFLIERN